jgi:hypothetical protein
LNFSNYTLAFINLRVKTLKRHASFGLLSFALLISSLYAGNYKTPEGKLAQEYLITAACGSLFMSILALLVEIELERRDEARTARERNSLFVNAKQELNQLNGDLESAIEPRQAYR